MSTHIQIDRWGELRKQGVPTETIGKLYVVKNGRRIFSCVTLELPWRGNRTGVSRLPAGRYIAEVVDSSPSFDYKHVWIHDAGSHLAAGRRSGVKVHIINFVRQLEGCIGVGHEFVDLDGDGILDITHSEDTLKALLSYLPQQTELHIKNVGVSEAETAALEGLDTSVSLSSLPSSLSHD